MLPELRKMVKFHQLNLTDKDWLMKPTIDVLFCRNVIIYFDKVTQFKILARMLALMPSDGLYIAGHSESFTGAGHLLTSLGRTTYRPVKGHSS